MRHRLDPRRAPEGKIISVRYAPQFPSPSCGAGSRAYLSEGLPGAAWWVAGRAVDRAEDADVELDEVRRLYTEHDMWDSAFAV